MPLLSRAEIDQELLQLDGWAFEDGALRKTFVFPDFPEAVAFVTRLVPGAEEAGHHPDIDIRYRRIAVAFVTHDEGGVTMMDVDGARQADRVAGLAP